jgi:hypothetical protein
MAPGGSDGTGGGGGGEGEGSGPGASSVAMRSFIGGGCRSDIVRSALVQPRAKARRSRNRYGQSMLP